MGSPLRWGVDVTSVSCRGMRDHVADWLHRLRLPEPNARLVGIVVDAANAMRAGVTDTAGLCEAAGIQPDVYRRSFGSRDRFLTTVAGLIVDEELQICVNAFEVRARGAKTSTDVARAIENWMAEQLGGAPSTSTDDFRRACAVLWANDGSDVLAKSVEAESTRLAFTLREWQGRWMARFDSDEITRAFLFVSMIAASWILPMSKHIELLDTVARSFGENTALDGPTRMLRADSWYPDLRKTALHPAVPDFAAAAERLLDGHSSRMREVVAGVATELNNDPAQTIVIEKVCSAHGVSRKTIYEAAESLERFRFMCQATFLVGSLEAHVETMAMAHWIDSPSAAELALSDYLQRFAEDGGVDRRAIRIAALTTRTDFPEGARLTSELESIESTLAAFISSLQARQLVSQRHSAEVIAYLLILHTVSRSIADSCPTQLPNPAWGWEVDILFGDLLATTPESIFRHESAGPLVDESS